MPTRLANAALADMAAHSPVNGQQTDIQPASDGDRPNPNDRTERLAQIAQLRFHRCTITGCGKEFKLKVHLARHLATAHGLAVRAGSPRPVMKTRAAFCLITTPLTRISRQVCKDILNIRHAARNPFQLINIAVIKQECQLRLAEGKSNDALKAKSRKPMEDILCGLGIDIKVEKPHLLHRADGEKKPPQRLSFPVPTNGTSKHPVNWGGGDNQRVSNTQPSIMKKRTYEQTNGIGSEGVHYNKSARYERSIVEGSNGRESPAEERHQMG